MHGDRLTVRNGGGCLVRRIAACAILVAGLIEPVAAAESVGRWGRLANTGFEGRRIRTTLFFSGQARDGTNPYGCVPAPAENLSLYTVAPLGPEHLRWSEGEAYRTFALDQMTAAGLNVVTMSSWGEDFLPCNESWGLWAPLQ
jgi:hypothetical protein